MAQTGDPAGPADHRAAYAGLTARLTRTVHEAPEVMAGFRRLHAASQGPGAIEPRIKELMALAISIAVHCEGCIDYHLHDALAAGATHAEVVDAVGVAVMMGGGPAVVYAGLALEALEQLTGPA
jgi:AhpD family alkylhydroperoxidase